MTLVDLSHPIRDGETTYPGLPAPVLGTHLSREASRARYAPGTEFDIGTITMVGNTGTYLDTPFHRYPDGFDLAGLDLERCVDLEGIVVRATDRRAIDADRSPTSRRRSAPCSSTPAGRGISGRRPTAPGRRS